MIPLLIDHTVNIRIGPTFCYHPWPRDLPNLCQPVVRLNGNGNTLVRRNPKPRQLSRYLASRGLNKLWFRHLHHAINHTPFPANNATKNGDTRPPNVIASRTKARLGQSITSHRVMAGLDPAIHAFRRPNSYQESDGLDPRASAGKPIALRSPMPRLLGFSAPLVLLHQKPLHRRHRRLIHQRRRMPRIRHNQSLSPLSPHPLERLLQQQIAALAPHRHHRHIQRLPYRP